MIPTKNETAMARAAPRNTASQKEVVERVMHAFKQGDLRNSDGQPVRNPRQAIAIALSESGSSDRVSPKRNSHALAHTLDGETRQMLLGRAAAKAIPGRTRMTKAALREAIARAR